MTDRVSIDIADGIAEVRFNRPDKRNALDHEQFAAIADAGDRVKAMPGIRVVVLSGEGKSFCAGLDLAMFGSLGAGDACPSVWRGDAPRQTLGRHETLGCVRSPDPGTLDTQMVGRD